MGVHGTDVRLGSKDAGCHLGRAPTNLISVTFTVNAGTEPVRDEERFEEPATAPGSTPLLVLELRDRSGLPSRRHPT